MTQILGKEKKVVMENPTYLQAYHTFYNMGYEMELLPVDESGLKVSEIQEKDPDIVYVMPSHQFPLGTVMPLKQRLELLKWASEGENRYLIEDDHDSEYRYRGKPIPSLQSVSRNFFQKYCAIPSYQLYGTAGKTDGALPQCLRILFCNGTEDPAGSTSDVYGRRSF